MRRGRGQIHPLPLTVPSLSLLELMLPQHRDKLMIFNDSPRPAGEPVREAVQNGGEMTTDDLRDALAIWSRDARAGDASALECLRNQIPWLLSSVREDAQLLIIDAVMAGLAQQVTRNMSELDQLIAKTGRTDLADGATAAARLLGYIRAAAGAE